MKIRVDVDVTPQELREFFGLPDVQGLQQELLGRIREGMEAGAEGFDPVSLLRPLFPAHMQGWEAMQKAFWAGIANAGKKDSE